MGWIETHIPAWIKIILFVGGIAAVLLKVGADYRDAERSLRELPITVAQLDSLVREERLNTRVERLEVRRDSVTASLREFQRSLEDLGAEVGEAKEGIDLAICLVRVQLGERRPLDCR